ncbi:endolytic transglycosylase MltG [Rickettsiales bacterium LUAb2]
MYKKYLLYSGYFILFLLFIFGLMLFSPGPTHQSSLVQISTGASTLSLAEELKQQKIIRNKYFFAYSMRIFGLDKKLVKGEFSLVSNQSIYSIMTTITNSKKVYFRKVTIPEGFTNKQLFLVLKANPYLSGGIPQYIKEGSLMPNTYYFVRGEARASIIDRMHKRMLEYLDQLWEQRDVTLPYVTKEDALTMASVIEKETANPEERFLIAGVFINRLKANMPLQSDPTVAYGLGIDDAKNLTLKDLRKPTPYNTYTKKGLPIMPIANPGKKSLYAAFHPAKTNYLYFVADGHGSHWFASNLIEHNANVRKWRAIQAQARAENK